jgi:ABC-type Zn2+ transport system substrate-binding protein/surface adhesin
MVKVDDSRLLECDIVWMGTVVPEVSKNRSVLIFRVNLMSSWITTIENRGNYPPSDKASHTHTHKHTHTRTHAHTHTHTHTQRLELSGLPPRELESRKVKFAEPITP